MQQKRLQESRDWTQFLNYNQFLCKKWRIIDSLTELLSQNFYALQNKETIWQIFEKNNVFRFGGGGLS